MSGSTNNITTQWSFRDGRDYVLSLTTTEMPNTVSFWISDKITGEEWTGCYDENGIEVITKRTGCYKSFQTFLSMIKSALLKKSDAVILELLNIDDLNAISLQRHHQQNATNGGGGVSGGRGKLLDQDISFPLNLQLYNSEINQGPQFSSLGQSSLKSNKLYPITVPTTSTATAAAADSSGGVNGSPIMVTTMMANNKTSTSLPLSTAPSLNKRKYLIVTYIAEFDKVHYPLPLNYSNPPDLNVMQKNILKLKAEVTSLQAAKKDLAEKLETITTTTTTSSSMPLPTEEERSSFENDNKADSDDNDNTESRRKFFSVSPKKGAHNNHHYVSFKSTSAETLSRTSRNKKNAAAQNNNDNSGSAGGSRNRSNVPSMKSSNDDVVVEINDKALSSTSGGVSCQKCSGTVTTLQARIRDLETAIDFQKSEHLQAMEKQRNENHFLQHKVEAAEKYEMELWNQLQKLKEKVVQADLDKEKQIKTSSAAEACKDCSIIARKTPSSSSSGQQSHQSRHDIFYSSLTKKNNNVPSASSSKNKGIVPSSPNRNLEKTRRPSSLNSQQGSRSYSSGSCSSVGSIVRGSRSDSPIPIQRGSLPRSSNLNNNKRNQRGRGSTSPYHPRNFRSTSSGRRPSPSPSRQRFDPTAYVAAKQQKLDRIATIRSAKMQRIEANIRSRSNSRTRSASRQRASGAGVEGSGSVRTANFPAITIDRESHRSSSRRGGVNGLKSAVAEAPTSPMRKSIVNSSIDDRLSSNNNKLKDNYRMMGESDKFARLSMLMGRLDKRRSHLRPRSLSADADNRRKTKEVWLSRKVERNNVSSTIDKYSASDKLKAKLRSKGIDLGERDDRVYYSKQLTSLNTPEYVSEANKRVLQSAAEMLAESVAIVGTSRSSPSGNRSKESAAASESKNANSSPVVIVKDEAKSMLRKSHRDGENYDITLLQTKLSALQAFLETCVPQKHTEENSNADF